MADRGLPPGPRTWRLVPAALQAARYLPGYLQRVAARYGDVACLAAGPVQVFLLSSPQHAQDLLVNHDHLFEKGKGERRFTRRLLGRGLLGSEGGFHRRQHDLVKPLLHGEALDPFADAVAERGERMQEGWRDGKVVDVLQLLAETTTDVMIEALFGTRVEEADGRRLRDALVEAVGALEDLPAPALPGIDRLPLPGNRRFDAARDRLDSILLPMVAARREAPRGDLATSLVRARGPGGDGMDDRLVRDEALSIFRGHRTAGTALCWAWYLLSRHPEVEARVFEEIDSVLGGRLPAAGDLPGLALCRMVYAESMRLFPPAWMLARRAIAEHWVGPYRVPAGSAVLTSPYVIHRDPRHHPVPRRFDPERFAPERRAGWHPFAYFPFGGGPKMCLGDEFAPFEGVLLMAAVGRRWRLRLAPGHPVEPAPRATLKPRCGMRMVVERRDAG